MNGDGDIAEHRFRASGRDGETRVVLRADDRIGDVVQHAHLLAVLGLFVAQRREAARAPVNDPVAAVDEPALVELDERFAYRARQLGRERVRRPVPVGGRTDRAQLAQNLAAGLLDEGNGAFSECRPTEIELGLALGRELLLDDVLGGDPGVVGARNPERLIPDHAAPADGHVLDGGVESVPHVQHGCHIGWGHHDHERVAVAAVAPATLLFGRKNSGLDPALVDGALGLAGVVLRRQVVKLLCCAHLRRKLTGAIFAGKTARLTRDEPP